MSKEQAAWGRLSESAPRGHYEHARSWEKRNTRRRNFAAKVEQEPATGCWVWRGQAPTRGGKPYPLFGVKVDGQSIQRSAFAWMCGEFFPELDANRPGRTSQRCGNPRCINPYHRVNKMATRNTLTATQAVAVYALRGSDPRVVGDQFGISYNQVLSIWNGRNWADVTGAPTWVTSRKITPVEVVQAILDRKGTMSARACAREFNVSNHYVGRVWRGAIRPGLSQQQAPC